MCFRDPFSDMCFQIYVFRYLCFLSKHNIMWMHCMHQLQAMGGCILRDVPSRVHCSDASTQTDGPLLTDAAVQSREPLPVDFLDATDPWWRSDPWFFDCHPWFEPLDRSSSSSTDAAQ